MEEEKRLDVEEIINIEKRVDVLEGQPETPLVCPIFKTDLDYLNDRITVLEGGTPPEVKNPMQLKELGDFEERVEELEEHPTPVEITTISKGDTLKWNPDDFKTALLSELTQAELSKEVKTRVSGGQLNKFISIFGPEEGDELEICVDYTGEQAFITTPTNTTRQFSWTSLTNESSFKIESLTKALNLLTAVSFEDIEYNENDSLPLYSNPVLTIYFADGTTKNITLKSEVLPITIKGAPSRKTDNYYINNDYTLNTDIFQVMESELPKTAKDYEMPAPNPECDVTYPTFIFLGPDTSYTGEDVTFVITGENAVGIGVNGITGDIYRFSGIENGDFSHQVRIGTISDYQYECGKTVEDFLSTVAQYINVVPGVTLDASFTLFNPAKIIVIGSESGMFNPATYTTADLTTEAHLFIAKQSN